MVRTSADRQHVLSVAACRRRLTVVVKISTAATERSDPVARAERMRASERRRRVTAALVLGALAVVVAFAAAPLAGSPGATVGGAVAAIILCLLAVAIWPMQWSDSERAHHELSLIWRQARAGADDEQVAWERYAAWAEPAGEEVERALVKRYVAEPGTDDVVDAMRRAEGWFMCRAGFVQTVRVVGLVAGLSATKAITDEWSAFGVVEVDQPLVEHAAALALERELRSLDSLHLAAALVLPHEDLVFATWDRRLHTAARGEGLQLLPQALA